MSQSPPLFVVTDRYELLALWRLVAEAKFQSNPDDADLWNSPYVHKLANRIADSMLDDYRSSGDQNGIDRHLRWRESLSNNVVLSVIQANLRRDASEKWWHAMTQKEKTEYVRGCIAPFSAAEEFLERLINDAEAQ